ncbi:hypothetical protein BM1_08649 [Bipolaris maydis]|nr:hypothetical protein BM1_08649 [Bipolaris maydis]
MSSSALGPVGQFGQTTKISSDSEGHATGAARGAPATASGRCSPAIALQKNKNTTGHRGHRRGARVFPLSGLVARHGVIAAGRQD